MSKKVELHATLRQDVGKGASRRLRRLSDSVPAIVYGAGKEAKNIVLEHRHIIKALENEAFFSQLITLHMADESQQVVLKALQRHPYKPKILHLDLMRVSAKEKITMHVPLHFLNGDKAPGVKEGGNVSHLMIDVEVSCLPKDLPEHIEVDLAHLGLDESIHLSELTLPAGVELTAFIGDAEHTHDQAVASIHVPRAVSAADDEESEGSAEGGQPEAAEGDAK